MEVSSKFPGKIILAGEHTILFGSSAIASSLNKYLTVILSKEESNSLVIKNSDETPISELIKDSIKYFLEIYRLKPAYFKVKIESCIPIGGYGSSTALVAATIDCLCKIYNINISKDKLVDLSIEIESSKKKVSGIDQNVIVRKGTLKFENKNSLLFERVIPKNKFIKHFLVINTGRPVEQTYEMLKYVEKNFNQNLFNKIESSINKFIELINKENDKSILSVVNELGEHLIELGIVSKETQNLIKDLELFGGVSKISGAGGVLKGSGALLYFDANDEVINYLNECRIEYFNTELF